MYAYRYAGNPVEILKGDDGLLMEVGGKFVCLPEHELSNLRPVNDHCEECCANRLYKSIQLVPTHQQED